MADSASRTGDVYFDASILNYIDTLHAPHEPALAHTFQSPAQKGLPQIQLAASEGKLLEVLLRLVRAKKVVEVGTLAGYSAHRMARALAPGGHLWTVEADARHAEVARENLAAAGLSTQVTVEVGKGREVLPRLSKEGPFCVVFIDADKENYDFYGRWALDNLRPGGLLIADNAFLFKELLTDSPRAQAMRRLHEMVAQECLSVCIPTPDGLLVGVRPG